MRETAQSYYSSATQARILAQMTHSPALRERLLQLAEEYEQKCEELGGIEGGDHEA